MEERERGRSSILENLKAKESYQYDVKSVEDTISHDNERRAWAKKS